MHAMKEKLALIEDILHVQYVEDGTYRGVPHPWEKAVFKQSFGGRFVAQALLAASHTVNHGDYSFVASSLHCYFVRPGNPNQESIYRVNNLRDGKSFCMRRVDCSQGANNNSNVICFTMMVTFQREEKNERVLAGRLFHQLARPPLTVIDQSPLNWPSDQEKFIALSRDVHLPERTRAYLNRVKDLNPPLEIRRSNKHLRRNAKALPSKANKKHENLDKEEPEDHVIWFRCNERITNQETIMQQAVAAYMSDEGLISVMLQPHNLAWYSPQIQTTSMDHSIWFHRSDFRVDSLNDDQWLVYVQSSPAAGADRGLAFGHMYAPDGSLLMTIAQEGLIRMNSAKL